MILDSCALPSRVTLGQHGSHRSSGCRVHQSHDGSDRLVADLEVRGKRAETPSPGQCAYRRLLLKRQFASAGPVPGACGRVTT